MWIWRSRQLSRKILVQSWSILFLCWKLTVSCVFSGLKDAGKFDYSNFSAVFWSKCHRKSLFNNLAMAPLEQVLIYHLTISSEIGKLTKHDISTCSPEGFEAWKQRWDSVTTITRFYELSNEIQKALFINVLSDDTIKRMNNLGQQDVPSYSIFSTSGM